MHRDDPELGYRFIADEPAVAGHACSERRVWRLCSVAGVSSVHSRKHGKGSRPGASVHDDLVERDFSADRAGQLWLTDIAEHPTATGKL